MSTYRTGGTPPPDEWVVVPGWGVGPGIVGRSTAEEVIGQFGADAQIARYESGEIFAVDYDYVNDEDFEPDRPAQTRRPSQFDFEFGLLKAITVGVYQTELYTREGVHIGMSHDYVIVRLGPPSAVIPQKTFDTLRYVHLGIEVSIDHDDGEVIELKVFRPRW